MLSTALLAFRTLISGNVVGWSISYALITFLLTDVWIYSRHCAPMQLLINFSVLVPFGWFEAKDYLCFRLVCLMTKNHFPLLIFLLNTSVNRKFSTFVDIFFCFSYLRSYSFSANSLMLFSFDNPHYFCSKISSSRRIIVYFPHYRSDLFSKVHDRERTLPVARIATRC